MKKTYIALAAALLFLAACQSPDRALFVTTTRIGVGYDLATTTGHIGFERSELFVGPAYPQTGAIPPVAASLQSDLRFIAPSVRQLYATGDAAVIATGQDVMTKEPDAKWDSKAGRKLAIVGTYTHVGLIVRTQSAAVSQVDFGYGRQEASLLPLRDPENPGTDIYPSTLASITVETNPSADKGGVRLSQFIATGSAARSLAKEEEVRKAFAFLSAAAAKDGAKAARDSLGLTLAEYDAAVDTGMAAFKAVKANVDMLMLKVLGAGPSDARDLSAADKSKLQAAAARLVELNVSMNDAARVAALATAKDLAEVRAELLDERDVRAALEKLP